MHSGFNILKAYFCSYMNDRRSCDRMVVGFGVVSSNLDQGEVSNIMW
jgi:hypothetical protein